MATIGTLTANLELQSAAFIRGLDRASAALRSQTAQMRRQTQLIERSFRDVGRSIDTVRAGFAALGAGLVVRNIAQTTVAFERINNTLRAGTGSAEGAAQAYAFVRSEAQRLGLDLRTAADQFGSLSAAARGTTLQGQGARDIFTAVAEAMTVLGRSSEQTEGAFRAIEQIISKGTVSSEELRGQLGERLPGAFQIAARSIGVTTQELGKMLQQGQVLSDDFLPKFAAELQRTFGPEADRAAQSLQASINRLNTAVFEFTAEVGRGGVASAITDFSQGLTEAARGSENLARQLGAGIGASIRALGEATLFVARHFREFAAALAAFVALRAAAIIGAVATAAFQLANALRLAAIGMIALNTAMGKNLVIKLAQALVAAGAAIGTYLVLTDETAGETEELTRQLGDLEEQLAGGSGSVAVAAGQAADALGSLIAEAQRENQQLTALRAAHDGYGASIEQVRSAIEIDNQLRAAKITHLQAEKSGLLELLRANQNLRGEIEAVADARAAEAQAAQDAARQLEEAQRRAAEDVAAEQSRQAERAEELMLEPFKNALRNIQSLMTDTFEQIFSGGIETFSDLAESIKAIFIRLAAEIATLMVIQPVLGALPTAVGGLGGSAAGFGGLAGLFSRGDVTPGLPGAGPGDITGFNPAAAGASWGSIFAAGALGALGGSIIAPLVFGGRGQSQFGGLAGGGLGAAAGFALGGPIGGLLGGAGGSLLGGLVGSFFGGNKDDNTGALRFATGRGSPFDPGVFGGLTIGGENSFAGPLRDIISQFDQGVSQFLTGRQRQLAKQAVQSLAQFEGRFPESDPSKGFTEILRQRGAAVLSAAFPNARTGRVLQGASSVEEIGRRVEVALQTIEAFNTLTAKAATPASQLRDALQGIRDQFAEIRPVARALGLDVSKLNAAMRDQLRATRQQATAALEAQRDALFARAGQIQDAFSALLDPLRALQADLRLTGASPAAAFEEIQRQFFAVQGRALTGDIGAIQQLPQLGRAFVDAAERFGASPARADASATVQAALARVIERTEESQERALAGISRDIRRADANNTSAIEKDGEATREALRRIERQLRQLDVRRVA